MSDAVTSARSTKRVWAANRHAVDYEAEAAKLGPPVVPIIDAHTHIHGPAACLLYDRARRLYGVQRTYTMSQLTMAAPVRDALGDSIRFITIPTWGHADRESAHRGLYLKDIELFHRDFGARMMKVWASPRLRDFLPSGATDLQDIDSPWRREHCRLAHSLGMMFMVHVADPDTWFTAKYSDSGLYGTKAHQYVGLERMLGEFTSPWIAAHMGGWPEDLQFLDGLLTRHPNLHIDTSATKWVVRELSRHARQDVIEFFTKWRGRILFGTDLVVMEDQLSPTKSGLSAMGDLASSPDEAFDLYCSRHLALRLMFEGEGDMESPIADPDLKMVEPTKYNEMSGPTLRGFGLPHDVLTDLYRGAAERLVEAWWARG